MPDGPVIGIRRLSLEQAAFVDHVFLDIERDLHVPRGVDLLYIAVPAIVVVPVVPMEVLIVYWVHRIIYALHPVAGQHLEGDSPNRIVADQPFPAGDERPWLRPEVGEH